MSHFCLLSWENAEQHRPFNYGTSLTRSPQLPETRSDPVCLHSVGQTEGLCPFSDECFRIKIRKGTLEEGFLRPDEDVLVCSL